MYTSTTGPNGRKGTMKYKIKNQIELDQFIEENNVDTVKSRLDQQLQSFDKIDDLQLGLKNGVMIFLVCDPLRIENFVVKIENF
jgi:hypothetical protein